MNFGPETASNPMLTNTFLSRRSFLGTTLAVFALAALPRMAMAAQASPDEATAFVDTTARDLSGVVNGNGSAQEKSAALQSIIDHAVDVNSVGRFCLGRFWRLATPAQQKDYIDLFHRVLVNNITGKVGDYKGVTIALVRAAPREDGVAVTTTVTRPNSAPSRVDWLVSNESGALRIVDVIAEGTSLRLTQRNDYAAYLSRNNNSIQALIDALKQQAANGT
jgi:phospholipid transport system substrate-binding protein